MKRKAKAGMKKKARQPKNICMRCERVFPSKKALQIHSRAHLQALYEIKMLQQGHTPTETKFGSEFKGKNKIIVS